MTARRFRLGFLTHVHGREPARELYPAVLDLFVAAEELGFDSGWVAQHHLSTGEGRLPSPFLLLSAAAARTRRIRLGTAVVTLSLDDPVRVAEDAAVLDAVAGGRLELGLGSGNPHAEQFAAFGRDPERRRELYAANLARLRTALSGAELAPGLTLRPEAPGLLGRIWESPLTTGRVRDAAAAGHGVLLGIGPADTVQAGLAHDYLTALPRDAQPRIAVVHAAFPGPDREQVAAELWPEISAQSLGYYAQAGWVRPDAGPDELFRAMNIHHGTPDDLVASLDGAAVLDVATDLVLAVQAHGTSVDRAIAALETIAREVAPRLGRVPAVPSVPPASIGVLS